MNAEKVLFHAVHSVHLSTPEGPVSNTLWSLFYGRPAGARSSYEARERVPGMGRDVGRVVGVDLDGPEVGFLEVDEEAGDEDCCQAV